MKAEERLQQITEWVSIQSAPRPVARCIHKLEQEIKRLRYYETTTLGLWCTDRPDLVDDPKKIMFQLKPDKK